jgi:DNA polymerase III gamma/tau subunit
MQQESANAMLKTLEEPPDDTLLLLCTDRPHAVLPTIVSRCQILRFTALAPDIIRSELVSRLSIKADDPRLDEVVHSGSLGRARSLFGQADGSDTRDALEFWRLIIAGDWIALFEKIDRISDLGDYGKYKNLFVQLLYNIRNAFFANLGGTENYIMGGSSLQGTLATITTPHAVEVLAQYCETAIGQIRARANIALVLTNFALSVMEFHHGKKQ